MGEEIEKTQFSLGEAERFMERLRAETRLARKIFEGGGFSNDGHMLGFEIEAWILDHNYFPSPINQRLLNTIDDPLVALELSRFNIELNCAPLPLAPGVLDRAEAALSAIWGKCNAIAHGLDANMVMIGTLPTIRNEDLTLANISPLNRYYALNAEVLRRRGGAPVRIDILGRDRLTLEHRDVMMEAATTSFQIHLKTPVDVAPRYYNAAIACAGPALAACGNAPFLFGKTLWEETRIPLFEQAVNAPGAARVSLGSGYARESCIELFEENARDYDALLPILYDDPPEKLRHLRLHNGVIWRWCRPLIGFEADGTPHLRVELRVLPSGPTIADMMANTALYLGMMRSLVFAGGDGAGGLPFAAARDNLYAAARHGLDARLVWPGRGDVCARDLLLETLIPQAREGLAALGAGDGGGHLDIVEARARAGQTGAAWQRRALAARDGAYQLMAAYCERQRSGAPAHQWEL